MPPARRLLLAAYPIGREVNRNTRAGMHPALRSLARASCNFPQWPIWIVSRGQSCLKIDLFSGDRVGEIQILGVQEISSIAGKAGESLKRLAF